MLRILNLVQNSVFNVTEFCTKMTSPHNQPVEKFNSILQRQSIMSCAFQQNMFHLYPVLLTKNSKWHLTLQQSSKVD